MRLSEAIRLGAMVGPQAFGETFGPNDSSCALGAALKAVGQHGAVYSQACDWFPLVCESAADPMGGNCRLVLSIIRWLNDEHQWTREQIADWVETQERATEQLEAVIAVDPVPANSLDGERA